MHAPAIAGELDPSTATRPHQHNLYEKLGVSDRAAAVTEAMRRGLIRKNPMPMNTVDELLRAAGDPLCDTDAATGGMPPGVCELLAARNGFFAFTSALYVRPSGDVPGDVVEWNRADGWRKAYGQLADGLFFFAEDVFGNQFASDRDGRVVAFDAETAGLEPLASSVRDWVKREPGRGRRMVAQLRQ